ncbi:MAG TPA: glycosyltransferase [Ignavibacteria bacterium]
MKKVAFISPESYLDVDLPIVKELNKYVKLLWIVTFATSKKNNQHIFSPDQIAEYSRLNNISHYNILSSYRVSDPRRIKWSLNIIRKIKDFDPDTIYFESFFDPYLAIFSRFYLGKKKTIIGLHDIELHPGADSFFRKLSHWIIMTSFQYYHVFSDSQLKLLKVLHPDRKTFLIGLFLKNFGDPKKVKADNEGRKVNFLFFGTDYPYKGLEVLIKAVNLLTERTSDFNITIAGKNDNFDRYRHLISDQSVYDLHLDFIKSEDIPDFFNNADFIVLPYNQVTQCGPLLIAFNYNIPVIASNLPFFKEVIVNEETGFLFPCGDHFQLAEIMNNIVMKTNIDILKMKNDLSKYVSKNYNLKNFIKKYLEMFSSVSQ